MPEASAPAGQLAIRPAAPSDVDAIHALRRDFSREEGIPFHEQPARAALEEALGGSPFARIWVVSDGDTLVGFAVLTFGFSLEFHGRDAFVDELYLAPAYRGRRIGTALLRMIEAACHDAGVNALHLEVDAHNDGARRLYERWGFAEHQRLLMSKRLG